MDFTQNFNNMINSNHILNHPFYQQWNEGKVPKETLKDYIKQYFYHVDSFPRYLSSLHSICDDLSSRQNLLDNLMEEEGGDLPHCKMWLQFAHEMDVTENDILQTSKNKETNALIEYFMSTCRENYAAGLGTLYSYEYQTPEVAKFKLDTLKNHYGLESDSGTLFYRVHKEADIEHSKTFQEMLEKLPEDKKQTALTAGKEAIEKMWHFLDAFPVMQ